MFWATRTPLSCMGWWTLQTAQLNATVLAVSRSFSVQACPSSIKRTSSKKSFYNTIKPIKKMHPVFAMIFYGIIKKNASCNILDLFRPIPPTLVLARPLAMVDVEVTIAMDPMVPLPAWPRIQPRIPMDVVFVCCFVLDGK